METIYVIKIGGNIIDDDNKLNSFLRSFSEIEGKKILVHGGGKLATEISSELGLKTELIDGRRVTDADTLKVITMVYAGWINKTITAKLNALSCKAIGLSGVDAQLIPSAKRKKQEIDYGFVGDVQSENINSGLLITLLESGITPVIAPVSSDAAGQLLNINADTIASSISGALAKHFEIHLIYCFGKKGVLQNVEDENSLIYQIHPAHYEILKKQKVIDKGMLPKIDNAFDALRNGVKKVVIGHAGNLNAIIKNEINAATIITNAEPVIA